MILNNKKATNRPNAQPVQQPMNNYNNSFNETDQYFNDFSQFNQTGYSTSTQKQPDGFFDMTQPSAIPQQYPVQNNYPPTNNFYPTPEPINNYPPQQFQQQPTQQIPFQQQQQQTFFNPMQPDMNNLFNDPMASMAVKYGSSLAGQGKEYVAQNVDKWFSISKLKYYFAVDTTYVAKKLLIILFPFINQDWSVKYSQAEAIPPKLDVNAPDMYIPVMTFVTYILTVGICLGIQNKFTPEQLGIQASSALGWFLFEIFLIYLSLQILSIKSTLKTFDIIAFCGYKYFGMILCLAASLLSTNGYHLVLIYCCISITYFMVRNLKLMILSNNQMDAPSAAAAHFEPNNTLGNKRRVYVLLFISLLQPLFMWWLTRHLVV